MNDFLLSIIANCPSCRTNAPRTCLSHTCPDCNAPSTDVESHVTCCDATTRDMRNATVALVLAGV